MGPETNQVSEGIRPGQDTDKARTGMSHELDRFCRSEPRYPLTVATTNSMPWIGSYAIASEDTKKKKL